jgi:hypothetical protein
MAGMLAPLPDRADNWSKSTSSSEEPKSCGTPKDSQICAFQLKKKPCIPRGFLCSPAELLSVDWRVMLVESEHEEKLANEQREIRLIALVELVVQHCRCSPLSCADGPYSRQTCQTATANMKDEIVI